MQGSADALRMELRPMLRGLPFNTRVVNVFDPDKFLGTAACAPPGRSDGTEACNGARCWDFCKDAFANLGL